MVCRQEHKLAKMDDIVAAEAWLLGERWRSEFATAVKEKEGPGQEKGGDKKWRPSAGVAILWKPWMAVTEPMEVL